LNIKQRKEKSERRYISGGGRGWFRVVDGKSLLLSSHDRLCPVNMYLNRDLIKFLFAFNKKKKTKTKKKERNEIPIALPFPIPSIII